MPSGKTHYNRVERKKPAKRFTLYLDAELHATVTQTAYDRYESISGWVEQACAEKLERDRHAIK